MVTRRSEETRQRLLDAALDLFERDGYAATTVVDIAAACGVSHMTFFRHFPTKEAVLLDDPYDPAIAAAVAAQDVALAPIERVAAGLLAVASTMGEAVGLEAKRRIAIANDVPELRAAVAANNRATEDAIVAACVHQGVDGLRARVAAAACLAAITVALLHWATTDDAAGLGDIVAEALTTVVPGVGSAR